MHIALSRRAIRKLELQKDAYFFAETSHVSHENGTRPHFAKAFIVHRFSLINFKHP